MARKQQSGKSDGVIHFCDGLFCFELTGLIDGTNLPTDYESGVSCGVDVGVGSGV